MEYYEILCVSGSGEICYEQKIKIETGSFKILSNKIKA